MTKIESAALKVRFFCLPRLRHCGTHFIAIYQGQTPGSERLATICGQEKNEYAVAIHHHMSSWLTTFDFQGTHIFRSESVDRVQFRTPDPALRLQWVLSCFDIHRRHNDNAAATHAFV